MDRRKFVAGLGLGLLAAPLAAEAQQAGKVYRVAVVVVTTPFSELAGLEHSSLVFREFVHTLRDLGYAEGRNLILERRSLEGRSERLPDVMAELVRLKVDVIVSQNVLMTRAAQRATTSIPIVMTGNTSPVENGLVASLAHPGGNVTGLATYPSPELEAKRLQLLKEAAPQISRVGFFGFKQNWDEPEGQQVQAGARALGLTIFHAEAQASDLTPVFDALTRNHADAIFVAPGSTVYGRRREIVEFAAKRRLPASYPFREAVVDGGLMSYGVNVADIWRRAAGYVDKVLKGTKPADLPIEQVSKFELLINLKTAKALKLTIPQSLLMRADEVIE